MRKILNNKIYRIIICFVLILSIFFVPTLISSALKRIGITNDILNSLLYLLIYSSLIVLVFFPELKNEFVVFKKNFKKCLDNGFKYWLLGLIIMVVSNLVINLIVFKGDIALNEELNRQEILNSPFYYVFLSTVIFGPIIEELIFRKSLEKIFNNKLYYILTSGFLFGFLHIVVDLSSPLNLLYIIPYGALGVSFALMNTKTNTSFTSIMMHMMHNFITCLLLVAVL